MKGWLCVVPLVLACGVSFAQSPGDVARDMARQLAGILHDPVSLSFQNLSALGAASVLDVRRTLESELRAQGVRLAEGSAPGEVRVTLSQNLASYLLVAEVKRGEDRRVLILPWPRPSTPAPNRAAASLDKTLILEAPEQILDLAQINGEILLLQPTKLSRLDRQSGAWETRESAALPVRAWPRDLRGRLAVQGGSYLAYLPGMICSGAVQPLDVRCRESDEAWPGEVRATFAANRNYFDGRVALANGVRRTIPSFYSVAGTEDAGGRLWLFAAVDGRVQLYDAALSPAGTLAGWGSDIAGAGVRCGNGTAVLATRPGEGSEKDAVHAYQIVERQAADMGAEVEMPGPVTALWPAGDNAALAVARNLDSGAYAAYSLVVACGP